MIQAAAGGTGFLHDMISFQWPIGKFMFSPLAENRIFGTNYYPYMQPPSEYHFNHEFNFYEKSRTEFWVGMVIAFAAPFVMTRVGLAWGDWMRRITTHHTNPPFLPFLPSCVLLVPRRTPPL